MADGEVNELAAKLQRRTQINEGEAAPTIKTRFNPATEFPEMTFKEIKAKQAMFNKVRADKSKDAGGRTCYEAAGVGR